MRNSHSYRQQSIIEEWAHDVVLKDNSVATVRRAIMANKILIIDFGGRRNQLIAAGFVRARCTRKSIILKA